MRTTARMNGLLGSRVFSSHSSAPSVMISVTYPCFTTRRPSSNIGGL